VYECLSPKEKQQFDQIHKIGYTMTGAYFLLIN